MAEKIFNIDDYRKDGSKDNKKVEVKEDTNSFYIPVKEPNIDDIQIEDPMNFLSEAEKQEYFRLHQNTICNPDITEQVKKTLLENNISHNDNTNDEFDSPDQDMEEEKEEYYPETEQDFDNDMESNESSDYDYYSEDMPDEEEEYRQDAGSPGQRRNGRDHIAPAKASGGAEPASLSEREREISPDSRCSRHRQDPFQLLYCRIS